MGQKQALKALSTGRQANLVDKIIAEEMFSQSPCQAQKWI